MLHPQRKTMDLVPLVCLCLLTWSAGTAADHKPVVVYVEPGSDVILPCSLSTQQSLTYEHFEWKKDQKQVFLYDGGVHSNNNPTGQDEQFKGRVFHLEDLLENGNASIEIRNTQLDDSGIYTCDFPRLQPPQTFYIKLFVVEPVVVYVEPGSDVVLPCSLSTQQSLTYGHFEWKKDQKQVFKYDEGSHSNNVLPGQDEQFKGRVSHLEDQLRYGIASIKIRNTQLADSGNYTCDFPRLQPPQTFYIKLVFGSAAKPYVRLVKTDDGELLQCEVKGAYPKPKVEWKDSAGNILLAEEPQVTERGGGYNMILQATVTKTDNFTCVVTQEELYHQMSDWIYAAPIEPVVVYVEPGSDVILPCSLSTQQSLTFEYFEWKKDQKQVFKYDGGSHSNNHPTGQDEQFKGRVFHFEDQLKDGIASIKIRNTQLADSGIYTCDFPRLRPPQTVHIKLVVAAKPYVRLVKTDDGVLLQCEVKGASPKPKVELKDSAGNILPAEEPQVTESGGSYDVILQAPVTKTDTFTCVVTQEELYHQSSDWTYAGPLNEKTSNNWIIGVVIGIVGAVFGIVGAVFGIVGIVLAVRARSERSNTAANRSHGGLSPDNDNSEPNQQRGENNGLLSSPETKSASKDQDNTPV